ncbi:MAG: hypothetical protein R3302_06880 [Sulfurimonadaceae bacterium]|nr:hypothetical protein [Sulfurimonadaceae bacterium]
MESSSYIIGLIWVAPLLIIALVILFARSKKGLLSEKEMLDKRLEDGEISKDEYEVMLRELEK